MLITIFCSNLIPREKKKNKDSKINQLIKYMETDLDLEARRATPSIPTHRCLAESRRHASPTSASSYSLLRPQPAPLSSKHRRPYHFSSGRSLRNAAPPPHQSVASSCGAQAPLLAPRSRRLRRCRGARAPPGRRPGHGGPQPVALLSHGIPPWGDPQGDSGGRGRGGELRGPRRLHVVASRSAAFFLGRGGC